MNTQFLAFGVLLALLLSVAGVMAAESTVDTVILATTVNYPDAMVVASASAKFGAPVLFTDPGSVPQETLDALASLNPKTIVIVGGPFVIKQAVEDALKAKGYNVVRLWGNTQYGTAVEIAKFFWADGVAKVVIVYDPINAPFENNTKELMAARVMAVRERIPIFLVPADKLPDEVNSTLVLLGVKKIVIVGSRAAIEGKLRHFAVEKMAGKDDDETMEKANEDRERTKVVIAAVADFKHMVAASVEHNEHASVILVSSEAQITPAVDKVLGMANITDVKVVGKPELAQKICDAFENSTVCFGVPGLPEPSGPQMICAASTDRNTTGFKLECRKEGSLAKIAKEVRDKKLEWKAINKELKFVRPALAQCKKLFEKDDENLDDASTDVEAAGEEEGTSDVSAANTTLGRAKALCEGGNFTQAMLTIVKARDEITKIRYRLKVKASRNMDSDETDEAAVRVQKSTQRLTELRDKLVNSGKATIAIGRILARRNAGDANMTAASKKGEKYCEKDADCACGRHITTGNCFYGNANYVNTTRQCPDFCTGIAGNFRIGCVKNECKQVRTATTASAEKKFTIRGNNFKFTPNSITVAKGDTVKITFMDLDGNHAFCLDGTKLCPIVKSSEEVPGGTSAEEQTTCVEGKNLCTKTLAAGKSDSLEFVARSPGIVPFYCPIGGHRDLGMEGNLTVTG